MLAWATTTYAARCMTVVTTSLFACQHLQGLCMSKVQPATSYRFSALLHCNVFSYMPYALDALRCMTQKDLLVCSALMKQMYVQGKLPDEFFEKQNIWLNRGNMYRLLLEPADIANHYGFKFFLDSGHYLAGNRAGR